MTRRLGKSVRITPLQIVLLVIAVAIGYKLIVFVSEFLSQSPSGESARFYSNEVRAA